LKYSIRDLFAAFYPLTLFEKSGKSFGVSFKEIFMEFLTLLSWTKTSKNSGFSEIFFMLNEKPLRSTS